MGNVIPLTHFPVNLHHSQAIASALPSCSSLASLILAWNSLSGGVQFIAWALTRMGREGGARVGGKIVPATRLTHIDLAGTYLIAEVGLLR